MNRKPFPDRALSQLYKKQQKQAAQHSARESEKCRGNRNIPSEDPYCSKNQHGCDKHHYRFSVISISAHIVTPINPDFLSIQ
jgi:hypothetical protein